MNFIQIGYNKYFYYRQRDKARLLNFPGKVEVLLYKLALGIYFSRRSG